MFLVRFISGFISVVGCVVSTSDFRHGIHMQYMVCTVLDKLVSAFSRTAHAKRNKKEPHTIKRSKKVVSLPASRTFFFLLPETQVCQ